MKQGMTLVEMATELERQRDVKKDFVADSRLIQVADDAKSLSLVTSGGNKSFEITPLAHKQLGERANLHASAYDRLLTTQPDLLAGLLNQLFQREVQKSMVRTLDGRVRAVRSESFRTLDNYDLFEAIYPVAREFGAVVESCQLTETKLYLKFLCPWLDRELPMPEGYVMGQGHNFFVRKVVGAIVVSNSEVGMGSLAIHPGVFEKQCTNLAVFKDDGYGRLHVGKRKGQDDAVIEYLSDETKRLDDAAVWARTRDVFRATMDGRVIDKIVERMQAARTDVIPQTVEPAKVVEVFGKDRGLTEKERGGLLRFLGESQENTRYGLQWAVTRLAGEAEDYDRASELERLGGQVIELPRSEWTQILKQAA